MLKLLFYYDINVIVIDYYFKQETNKINKLYFGTWFALQSSMTTIHPETRIENGIIVIFRGTFLGLPVYSPEITDTDTAKPDVTVVARHEEIVA